jgi:glycosyltransferase involved in cell wall biosynthesis
MLPLTTPAAALPNISVVVFVLNASTTLSRALSSVLRSDQPPVELLVLDGGSTDGTVEVIRRFEDKIAFWRSHHDGGSIYALNEGVARATGDIILLLPADDWVEPGALHAVRNAFAKEPDLDVLSCGVRIVHFDDRGELHEDALFDKERALDFSLEKIIETPLTAARFMARRIYQEVGSWNPEYKFTGDLDFLLKVYFKRPKTAVSVNMTYTYVRHPGSQTLSGNPLMVIGMMENNILMAERYLKLNLTAQERRVLRASHGRWSARLAGMLIVRGELFRAMHILKEALLLNWFWPVQVWWWLGKRVLTPPDHL